MTYPFPSVNGATIEVCEWPSNFTPKLYWAYDSLSILGLKLIHVSKRCSWTQSSTQKKNNWVIVLYYKSKKNISDVN